MVLTVYNTLSRKKEPFETLVPGEVSMYVCGPTVYDKAHVGHGMSVLVFDVIRRYLVYRGYQVRHVINYTDVDDKIILKAQAEGVEPLKLAETYIREFDQHIQDLNILEATVYPRATQEIGYITEMIAGLIAREFAYVVDGDVYFRVNRDPDYGKLSGRRPEEMVAGARVKVDSRKEHPADFALWKASKPGEPAWESPWSDGRPGWHIECSAMNLHHLGEQIDIHGGGSDLVFPHHENEIAQSESFTGKPFARYWMHNGMMQLGGEKMSKSLGNLVTIEAFLADHEADVLRMMVLNSSYRSPLTFSDETVQQAVRALERLRGGLRPAYSGAGGESGAAQPDLQDQLGAARAGFETAMDDDFNTAGAMGHIFELVRAINQARDAGASAETLGPPQDLLLELTGVLGLRLKKVADHSADIGPLIDLLVEIRDRLRQQKHWELADLIRDRLAALDVVVEDTKGESIWRWLSKEPGG